jgi:hypothetical protein
MTQFKILNQSIGVQKSTATSQRLEFPEQSMPNRTAPLHVVKQQMRNQHLEQLTLGRIPPAPRKGNEILTQDKFSSVAAGGGGPNARRNANSVWMYRPTTSIGAAVVASASALHQNTAHAAPPFVPGADKLPVKLPSKQPINAEKDIIRQSPEGSTKLSSTVGVSIGADSLIEIQNNAYARIGAEDTLSDSFSFVNMFNQPSDRNKMNADTQGVNDGRSNHHGALIYGKSPMVAAAHWRWGGFKHFTAVAGTELDSLTWLRDHSRREQAELEVLQEAGVASTMLGQARLSADEVVQAKRSNEMEIQSRRQALMQVLIGIAALQNQLNLSPADQQRLQELLQMQQSLESELMILVQRGKMRAKLMTKQAVPRYPGLKSRPRQLMKSSTEVTSKTDEDRLAQARMQQNEELLRLAREQEIKSEKLERKIRWTGKGKGGKEKDDEAVEDDKSSEAVEDEAVDPQTRRSMIYKKLDFLSTATTNDVMTHWDDLNDQDDPAERADGADETDETPEQYLARLQRRKKDRLESEAQKALREKEEAKIKAKTTKPSSSALLSSLSTLSKGYKTKAQKQEEARLKLEAARLRQAAEVEKMRLKKGNAAAAKLEKKLQEELLMQTGGSLIPGSLADIELQKQMIMRHKLCNYEEASEANENELEEEDRRFLWMILKQEEVLKRNKALRKANQPDIKFAPVATDGPEPYGDRCVDVVSREEMEACERRLMAEAEEEDTLTFLKRMVTKKSRLKALYSIEDDNDRFEAEIAKRLALLKQMDDEAEALERQRLEEEMIKKRYACVNNYCFTRSSSHVLMQFANSFFTDSSNR